ncbi:MAG: metallophosphoesterase [Eubacterium sp.]|nr:metallophosphoesterase [Eubacterium sp.]
MLVAGIIIGIIAILLIYGYLSHYHLVTTTYTVPLENISAEHTVVLLSDLHCCYHGEENEKLLDRIRQANPDCILISGDMVTKHMDTGDARVQKVLRFLKQLSKQYPVYYSPGNHEIRMNDYEDYQLAVSDMGIQYIANQERVFPYDNIRFFGLDLPIERYRSREELTIEDIGNYLGQSRADDRVATILLAHDPRYFDTYVKWGADLTVSGHLHGGILRLPFLGGVFSPYLQLFPNYSGGKYEKKKKTMIVSRGLGTHHVKFRWFNPPELVVIRLQPKL